MPLRDHREVHRASTPLELLFDLCFAVSVAVLADLLFESVVQGHALDGAVKYALLFIPVWWTWMLFSWFATAFDNDDVTTRLLTLVVMGGALGLAASMPEAYENNYVSATLAYAAARVPLVILWTRGAKHHPAERTFALRYARGSRAPRPCGCCCCWSRCRSGTWATWWRSCSTSRSPAGRSPAVRRRRSTSPTSPNATASSRS
ncbi:hypothetical protein GCM10029964_038530 [Kibdelosporangium lantanae]